MKEAVIHLGIIPGIGFAYSLRGASFLKPSLVEK